MIGRVLRYSRWKARLAGDWLRGGAERHRAVAHWRAGLLRRRVRRTTRRGNGVVVALVEHFGDLIAAEPLIRAARARHREARLIFVVGEKYAALVADHPGIDELITVNCLSEWYLLSGRTGAIAEYDLHLPGRVCPVCQSVVRPTPPSQPVSVADYYARGSLLDAFSRASGLEACDRRPRLHLPTEAHAAVDRLSLPRDFLVVHCQSIQAERDWPAQRWADLVGALRGAGHRIVEIGLSPVLPPAVRDIDLAGKLSLVETCEVIRRAGLFIGIDSGPAHVANAAGVPGILLLGEYAGFGRRMPYSGDYADGSLATIIQHDGPLAELPVELALAAVQTRLQARTSVDGALLQPALSA